MENNPYQAPVSDSQPPSESPANKAPTWLHGVFQFVKPIFIQWELLRILFNAICGIVVIKLCSTMGLDWLSLELLPDIILGAIFANIGFMAGPIVESYFSWLGFKTIGIRVALFLAGTGLTSVLAYEHLRTLGT